MPAWLRIGVVVVGVVALTVGLLWAFQRRLIYQPDAAAVPPAGEMLPGAVDVDLQTGDGLRLRSWYLAAPPRWCRATVLIASGNAGNRLSRAPLAAALSRRGFGVLLLDYRGYGGNPGSPSEDGLAADAAAAYRFLVLDQGLADRELIYFGESLGAAVVARLASDHPPAALVLRSPFTDLGAVAQRLYPVLPVQLLLRDRFPVRDTVIGLRVPTLVIFGTADSLVPPAQSQAVADATGGPVEVLRLEGADHNDPEFLDGPTMIDSVAHLAIRAGCPPESAS
jgi:fermentation-respiration switch protein FrsA (DUF1100 family)